MSPLPSCAKILPSIIDDAYTSTWNVYFQSRNMCMELIPTFILVDQMLSENLHSNENAHPSLENFIIVHKIPIISHVS